ncbi:MAG: class I SAM-dependent methyltransferase [Candidatus Aminicenantes bacterium]|nr:MAG: class I SAM-dependent methyltransferase [Candidatus Aminicenantes bacterium]
MTGDIINPGSFRDTDGFLFSREGVLYRQVNTSAREDYQHLMNSGLYQKLVDLGLLIPHQEVDLPYALPEKGYKILQPRFIPFISYPYEWCFSQLKDAALTTLALQKIAFQYGMTLKDSSAYNIQFLEGKPVLVDTLSFEKYREGEPWVAYRQFCQHFLAPLALMSLKDIRLGQLLRVYIDGIPLDLAALLLPLSARFNLSLSMHIYLHSKTQKRWEHKTLPQKPHKFSRLGFLGIIDSLESAVKKLKWVPGGTQWDDYYQDANYSPAAMNHKKVILSEWVEQVNPAVVWDLGANIGRFSRIAADKGILTISFDMDPAAVEKNYLQAKEKGESRILPLLLDLTNPSPGIGWENLERSSFMERGPVDLILSLALIHHLAISNNVPLGKLASFFSRLCCWLVMEFVPKSDSQVQRLLATREDIFQNYTQEAFETGFSRYFSIQASAKIKDSERTLYLLKRIGGCSGKWTTDER